MNRFWIFVLLVSLVLPGVAMGYDLYITRADLPWKIEEEPISEAEWRAVADNDPDLEISKSDIYYRKNDDGSVERFHPWIIKSHPNQPPLWFMDGAIDTKNPDKLVIKKMVELANKLNAKVIGEHGEVYDSDGNFKHID